MRFTKSQKGKTTIFLILFIVVLLGTVIYLVSQNLLKSSSNQTGGEQESTFTRTAEPTTVEGKPLPEKDASGTKELGIVDRYPESVLVGYSKGYDRESFEYVAKATLDEVKEYYINSLQELGWQIKESGEDNVIFEKGEHLIHIHLYFDQSDQTLEYYLDYITE